MKTTTTTILLTAICVSGLLLTAAAQPAGQPDNNTAGRNAGSIRRRPPPARTTNNAATAGCGRAAQPAPGTGRDECTGDGPARPSPGLPAEPRTITSTVIVPRGEESRKP